MTEPEDYINNRGRDETGPPKKEEDTEEIEEQRESLAILVSSGTIKDFVGVEMSLGDVHKLPSKSVKKYYNRYQAALSRQATSFLVNSGIDLASRGISYLIPIDDPSSLSSDIEKDELVRRELSNVVSRLVFKGGRYIALASALLCLARHVKISLSEEKTPNDSDIPEEDKSEDQ